MQVNEQTRNYWNQSKQHLSYGLIAFGAQLGSLGWLMANGSNGGEITAPIVGVLVSGIVSAGFLISSNTLRKNAILQYNELLESTSLRIGATNNGIGLALQF